MSLSLHLTAEDYAKWCLHNAPYCLGVELRGKCNSDWLQRMNGLMMIQGHDSVMSLWFNLIADYSNLTHAVCVCTGLSENIIICCFFPGICMGSILLPGTTGVQCFKRDVYRHQRDPGEFITPILNKKQTLLFNPTCCYQFLLNLLAVVCVSFTVLVSESA